MVTGNSSARGFFISPLRRTVRIVSILLENEKSNGSHQRNASLDTISEQAGGGINDVKLNHTELSEVRVLADVIFS